MTRDFYFLFLNGLLVENFVHLLLVGLVLLLFRLFLLLLGLIFIDVIWGAYIYIYIYISFKGLKILFGWPRLLLLNPNSWNTQVRVFNTFF